MLMPRLGTIFVTLVAMMTNLPADDSSIASLEREFKAQISPLIKTHCSACHDSQTEEAGLDLSRFVGLKSVVKSHGIWKNVLERVAAGEMPPEDATRPLNVEQRRALVQWIGAVRQFEAERNAGDPGPVLARRLSNAEYDYSIRDLTGIDIRPTRSFPVDPANESGFDNSGESLTMSPALIKKYLEAARRVADHLLLTPSGIRFAPHPVVTDTDRDKYCVKRIVEFYQRQPTDYADYFSAAWDYLDRTRRGHSNATLDEIAQQHRVSPKYLSTVWHALTDEAVDLGPLATLQQMWAELPVLSRQSDAVPTKIREACIEMRDHVVQSRKQFEPTFDNLSIDEVHRGTQAFVLWKNKQYAAHRRLADFDADDGVEDTAETEEQKRYVAACKLFCVIFPDAFYISERGRGYLGKPDEQKKGRLLSAGFHSMMGYFRDDQPLSELILDDQGRRHLDRLWQELDFITAAPLRQYQGFLWFDRTDSRFMRDPEFDFARPENQASLNEPMIKRLAKVYLAKATRNGGKDVALQAISDYFLEINQQIRWVEQTRHEAESHHLDGVIALAEKAYRRRLTSTEQLELREFYRVLREEDQVSHQEAIEDLLVFVLMSPRFCYRVDLLNTDDSTRPLDDVELASRLSYFLWSSLPDAELMRHAAAGDLREPKVLLQQTRRMLVDNRIRALATEFGGNWLDFRRFEEHNSVDRERFPMFDDQLRSAMFEEPIRFFVDLVQQDRSALDFLYADRTFVNASLAEHYGMDDLDLHEGQWREIADASSYGRGGLLPMAVFMTKNAPGLRTSPVKRGYWVVRRLLGERIPPPPPNVPELPDDESKLGELTLRQTLARHRDHESCAGCHDRFDAIGIAFEGFGPVGEQRDKDLGGRPVDASAEFPDGTQRDGLDDLRSYLREMREAEFVGNLSRKLLSYALGRTLLLSDEALLEKMQTDLSADGHQFSNLVDAIVTSPQFLNKRGRNHEG